MCVVRLDHPGALSPPHSGLMESAVVVLADNTDRFSAAQTATSGLY